MTMIAEHETDTLTAYNEGLGTGMEIEARKGWRPLSFDDPFNTPPTDRLFVGIKKNYRKGSNPWIASVMRMVPETGYGDTGYDFEGYTGGYLFRPEFWCPLPDPNDFASV